VRVKRIFIFLFLILVLCGLLVSCIGTDANVASYNLSKAADQFQVYRRVVFYNGITDSYMLVVEGYCSIKADTLDGQLELTVKVDDDQYLKHFLGLSDNVTYFVEQLDPKTVSKDHYKVIFKPKTIIPDIDIK